VQRVALRGAVGMGVHHLAGARAVLASSASDEAAAVSTITNHLRSLDTVDLLRATPAVSEAVETLIRVSIYLGTPTAMQQCMLSPRCVVSPPGFLGVHPAVRWIACRWAPREVWLRRAWRKAPGDGRSSTCRTFARSRSLSVRGSHDDIV
jgi:hypothetical protein